MIKNAFKKCIFTFAFIIRLIKGTNLLTIKYIIMDKLISNLHEEIKKLKDEINFLKLLKELKEFSSTSYAYDFETYRHVKSLYRKEFIDYSYQKNQYMTYLEDWEFKSYIEMFELFEPSNLSNADLEYIKSIKLKFKKLNKYLSNRDLIDKYQNEIFD